MVQLYLKSYKGQNLLKKVVAGIQKLMELRSQKEIGELYLTFLPWQRRYI